MKRIVGGFALVVALSFLVVNPDVAGQPPAKGKTAAPKAVDKTPDKSTDAGAVFEVYKDNSGDFRFRIKDGDTLLATSGKGYKDKADCMKIIKMIQREASKAKIDDQSK